MLQCRIKQPIAPPLEAWVLFTERIVTMQYIHAADLQALVCLSQGLPVLLLPPVVTIFTEISQRLPIEQKHGPTNGTDWGNGVELEPILGEILQDLAYLKRPQPSSLSFRDNLADVHIERLRSRAWPRCGCHAYPFDYYKIPPTTKYKENPSTSTIH